MATPRFRNSTRFSPCFTRFHLTKFPPRFKWQEGSWFPKKCFFLSCDCENRKKRFVCPPENTKRFCGTKYWWIPGNLSVNNLTFHAKCWLIINNGVKQTMLVETIQCCKINYSIQQTLGDYGLISWRTRACWGDDLQEVLSFQRRNRRTTEAIEHFSVVGFLCLIEGHIQYIYIINN